MDDAGITYDPTEFKRFTDPERTILADGQSAWEKGQPWHRLLNLGTNMFQKVSGPDGNKLGSFEGNSGVKIGIAGSSDPVLHDFGDLYANFVYSGGGGTMEVPLVRGSILLTHIFTNANPVVTPFCLDNINGQHAKMDCPLARASSDGGSGYLSATCSGSTMKMILHNTRAIKNLTQIQWAANKANDYQSNHRMNTCDASTCRLLDGGKQVEITVPNAAGDMSFAINYIGHYLLPPNWINQPQQVTCTNAKRDARVRRSSQDINLHAFCDDSYEVTIQVDLAGNHVDGLNKIQFAVEETAHWGKPPPMRNCDTFHCSRTGDIVTIRRQMHSSHIKIAINVIGLVILPWYNWIEEPLALNCGSGIPVDYGGIGGTHTRPTKVTQPPTTTQGPASFHPPTPSSSKFILEMNEPGTALPDTTRKFVLYFSSEVNPQVSGNSITFTPKAGGKYNGIVQVAYLGSGPRGDRSNNAIYDKHAGVYSYKPKATYCVSEANRTAHASFLWNPDHTHQLSSSAELIMMCMPHHSYILKKKYASNLNKTTFGFDGFVGPSWDLEMEMPRASMLPETAAVAAIVANDVKKQEMLTAIERDAKNQNLDAICAHSDSYNVGKAIGFVARLASISRAFKTSHYQKLDNSIKNCLEKWLRINDTLQDKWKFKYDTVWGGLFLRATDGNLQFGVDYGFPYYNDHHFHLGYFLYAMAYYVEFHSSWGTANKHRIYAVARDVSNPNPKDPYFPTFRQKDIYTGFSWATGVVPGTRQEESASESINCYHGVAALGEAMNDDVLKHTGQVMLAMELLSVREYWQVRQHNRDQFPAIIQETGVCGQISEDSFYVYTLDWPCDPNIFPMRHACLVGIQIIPITSVSKYWVDKEWAGSIKHSCTSAINPQNEPDYSLVDPTEMRQLNGGWAAFCHAAMAPLDIVHQSTAADFVKDKRPQELVGGTGAASTLLFIYGQT